jgi:Niemann-Pick C1 protein
LVAFAALLAVCCSLGVPNLSVEDNTRAFVPDGSYLLDTFAAEDKYFSDAGVSAYIVTTDFDYFEQQGKFPGLKQDVARLSPKFLLDPFEDASSYNNWYDAFVTYCGAAGYSTFQTDKTVFYQALHAFLDSSAGGFYKTSVVFSGDQEIVATRVETELKSVSKYYEGRLQTDAVKAVAAMDKLRSVDWSVPAYPWTYSFQTWETFKVIEHELYFNVLQCLVAVLLITTLLIGHPGTSGLVFLCVIMTVADILGCMYFWGLFIDNVSVIQTVIAIGLCVDYAAHVGHCFMLKAGTRDERVTATLTDVGAAVFNGGFSTFLAVLLLSGSKSYVFRVLFQQFFLTVVLGLAHGMILLPVLLSIMGPQCYAAVAERAELQGKYDSQQKELGTNKSQPPVVAVAAMPELEAL